MYWDTSLAYASLSYMISERSHYKNLHCLRMLLFLSGNIELNPGPLNYQLSHPNLCGYYRAAIHSLFHKRKLIPPKDKDGNDILEYYPNFDEGLDDLKTIFQGHFSVEELEWKKFEKIKAKYLDIDKKWSRGRSRDTRKMYFDYFSTSKWVKLSNMFKSKHSLKCDECNKSSFEIQAKYPSTARTFEKERENNIQYSLNKSLNSRKSSGASCNELTQDICSSLDDSYTKELGMNIGFVESVKKCYNLENKKTPQERRALKEKHVREVTAKLNTENENTVFDRVYGQRVSLNRHDGNRKRTSFESAPDAAKRTSIEKAKIENGLKKPKNHVGKFSSYEIDEQSFLATAASWTDDTPVV